MPNRSPLAIHRRDPRSPLERAAVYAKDAAAHALKLVDDEAPTQEALFSEMTARLLLNISAVLPVFCEKSPANDSVSVGIVRPLVVCTAALPIAFAARQTDCSARIERLYVTALRAMDKALPHPHFFAVEVLTAFASIATGYDRTSAWRRLPMLAPTLATLAAWEIDRPSHLRVQRAVA
jgi:hypothetical protein